MCTSFLALLLCACGSGTSDEESPDIGSANPDEVPTSTSDNAAIVGSDDDSDLTIVEVINLALLAIDEGEEKQPVSPPDTGNLPGTPVTPVEPDTGGTPATPIEPDTGGTPVTPEPDTGGGTPVTPPDTDAGGTPVAPTDTGSDPDRGNLSFRKFTQNDLPDTYRTMFGCDGAVEDRWLTVATSWPKTWPVSSRDQFDSAISNMDDGDRILIESGTNLGSVELSGNGSPNAKKYIMGESGCSDTSGPTTFSSNTRFTITGNDWAIMNLKFLPSGSGRAFKITGARNWVYNNRIENAGEVLFEPLGTADKPATTGNRIVGNYFNGRNDYAGIRILNPFTPQDGASVHDTVIGGNTFENYEEPTFASKVITDVSFGWNYPYGSSTDLPGSDTFTELGWNHFINCHGEVPTSKTRRWMIHNNLYEVNSKFKGKDTPHISLRSGDDKLVFRNIFLDGSSRVAQTGIQLHGKRSHGYYNVVYRTDNGGIGFSWTTTESFSYYPFPEKTWFRNERIENIDWRYNFFLGDGRDSATWMNFVVIGGFKSNLPPINNTVRENFYSAENPDDVGYRVSDFQSSGLGQTNWESSNPNATRALQHFARRSGNVSNLDAEVTVPANVTVKGFWLNGDDVSIDAPPWIGEGSGYLIDLEK